MTIIKLFLIPHFETLISHIQIHSWDDVLNIFIDAASRIQVKAINGGSADAF